MNLFSKTKLSILAASIASISLFGCATKPEDIQASYVSPMQYNGYNCRQLAEEATRVSDRASKSAGIQSKKASNDAVATGVGIVLFWPMLFMIKGDGATEVEIAKLKGEMETIEKVSIEKKCNFEFKK